MSIYSVPVSPSAKWRRRWFGAICLLAAFGMLVAGETLLKGNLRGLTFIIYWLGCFAFTVLAICVALVDARAIRREGRERQSELLERTLDGIEKRKQDPG